MVDRFPGTNWAESNARVAEFYEDGCHPAYPTDTDEDEVRNQLAQAVLRGEYNEVNLEGVGVLLVPGQMHDEVAALLNIGLMQVGYRGEQDAG